MAGEPIFSGDLRTDAVNYVVDSNGDGLGILYFFAHRETAAIEAMTFGTLSLEEATFFYYYFRREYPATPAMVRNLYKLARRPTTDLETARMLFALEQLPHVMPMYDAYRAQLRNR